jgi:hypothetical protein
MRAAHVSARRRASARAVLHRCGRNGTVDMRGGAIAYPKSAFASAFGPRVRCRWKETP